MSMMQAEAEKAWVPYKEQISKIIGADNWKVYRVDVSPQREIKNPFSDNSIPFSYKIEIPKIPNDIYSLPKTVAGFSMQQQYACCGIAVTTCEAVYSPYNNKGLGTLLAKLVLDLAREARYSMVLSTDVDATSVEVLKGVGYEEVLSVFNKKTSNTIKMVVKRL